VKQKIDEQSVKIVMECDANLMQWIRAEVRTQMQNCNSPSLIQVASPWTTEMKKVDFTGLPMLWHF
jgi:hypothetical protein